MSNFITNLSEKLSQCRTRLLTAHVWRKFFERKVAMTEVEVQDMLRFSHKFDLKELDPRYKDLLALDLYRKCK